MNRRSFLGSILALSAAPAIVRADSLMRVVARDTTILLPWQELIAEALRVAHRNSAFIGSTVAAQWITQMDGATFNIRRPNSFTIVIDGRRKES